MKKNIFKSLENMLFSSLKPGATALSIAIILVLIIVTLISAQIFSFFRPDNTPDVSFELEDFTRMNLVDRDEAEVVPASEEEILAERILNELDKGFIKTAERIFEREDRINILRQHLPPAMRILPNHELRREMGTAIEHARVVFRARSGASLRRRLSSLPDEYRDHYTNRLTRYLTEAFKSGVKVFSVIDRNNRELDVTTDIERSTAYRHFNRLYNSEVYRLRRKNAKDTGVEDSLERLIFYFSLLMFSVIVILLGIMIAIMRVERRMDGKN